MNHELLFDVVNRLEYFISSHCSLPQEEKETELKAWIIPTLIHIHNDLAQKEFVDKHSN